MKKSSKLWPSLLLFLTKIIPYRDIYIIETYLYIGSLEITCQKGETSCKQMHEVLWHLEMWGYKRHN